MSTVGVGCAIVSVSPHFAKPKWRACRTCRFIGNIETDLQTCATITNAVKPRFAHDAGPSLKKEGWDRSSHHAIENIESSCGVIPIQPTNSILSISTGSLEATQIENLREQRHYAYLGWSKSLFEYYSISTSTLLSSDPWPVKLLCEA